MFFWRLSQLITFSVSAVAPGWFVDVFRSIFSSKAVLRGPGRPKLMCKKTSSKNWWLKKDLCQNLRPPKIANVILFIYLWYQLLYFCYKWNVCKCLGWFVAKNWQTSPPGKMMANVLPPKSGGLVLDIIYSYYWIYTWGETVHIGTTNRIFGQSQGLWWWWLWCAPGIIVIIFMVRARNSNYNCCCQHFWEL